MRIVVQKVKNCTLYSNGEKYSHIDFGMLVLVGVCPTDNERVVDKIANKILKMRIFDDEHGKTNKTVFDVGGNIMVVSNFTLYSNLKGTSRPDFIGAARPDVAEKLYQLLVKRLRETTQIATGVFRTYMEITMTADGPGTYIYEENA